MPVILIILLEWQIRTKTRTRVHLQYLSKSAIFTNPFHTVCHVLFKKDHVRNTNGRLKHQGKNTKWMDYNGVTWRYCIFLETYEAYKTETNIEESNSNCNRHQRALRPWRKKMKEWRIVSGTANDLDAGILSQGLKEVSYKWTFPIAQWLRSFERSANLIAIREYLYYNAYYIASIPLLPIHMYYITLPIPIP